MRQGIVGFFKLLFMLYALIALASIILNAAKPWEGDLAAKNYIEGYLSLAVGGSSVGAEIHSRSYALIPVSATSPKMLFVAKSDDGEFSTETDFFAFWFFGCVIVYGWYLIIKSTKNIIQTKRLSGGGATKT